MKKLSLTLSKKSLLTIYKFFVGRNLDYADIIYDKPFHESSEGAVQRCFYAAHLQDNSYAEVRFQ